MFAGAVVMLALWKFHWPVIGSTFTGGMERPVPVMVTVLAILWLAGFTVLTPATVNSVTPLGGAQYVVTVTTSLPGGPTRTIPHMPFRKSVPMKVRKR